ncbi:RagB/SusD family nutrient uptake outer membrane protein [Fulvivirga lutea]|uniref:RagB/SusD family nutrient uptake outer membrane protein n=1 Tax=Fulvivirga lutea TaxID=2810512 RepID=A0A975A0D6_9BACT|nr:RagB/SusD family nutrient uptake outer membrane protein [Fulvivirga lutea]QSE96327.1 RagB/SusD family nutrient uptake outer membrane protein [Fulvivirga lutea]
MKYIIIYGLFLTGCNVLDQEPETFVQTQNALVDRQSATAAVNGLYHTLQDGDYYGGRYIMATEMVAGNGTASAFQAFWQELASGRVPASNFHVEDSWIALYATVNAANIVIEYIPQISELTESEKSDMLGQAYFIRGLAFFDALRQYGEFFNVSSEFGIPLKLQPSLAPSETARATVANSYTQIESDLQEAIDRLESASPFFASKVAAKALKARVHLYQNEFDQAETLATEVINELGNLPDDYNEIYTTEESSEAIFELEFIQQDDPNVWSIEMYNNPPEVSVTNNLIDFFNNRNENERGMLFETTSSGLNRCIKYGTTPQEDGENTIIIRLSEMYLIRAEALGRDGVPNDALPDINAVRNRAGLTSFTNIASDAELLTVLLNERRAEFAFEGHYWFDMVRYGRMESIRGLESFRRIFPIPRREINISDGTLVQNPEYN